MEGRVVVLVSLSVGQYNETGIFAARIEALGLTSYGYSIPAAQASVKRLFNTFINSYRQTGRLEQRLNQLGVKWHWAEDYTEPYEDTDNLPAVEEADEGWQPIVTQAASPDAADAQLQPVAA